MSTRDELAELIDEADHRYTSAPQPRDTVANHIADALIAEGWRKKPSREEIIAALSDVARGRRGLVSPLPEDRAADAILALMDRGE